MNCELDFKYNQSSRGSIDMAKLETTEGKPKKVVRQRKGVWTDREFVIRIGLIALLYAFVLGMAARFILGEIN